MQGEAGAELVLLFSVASGLQIVGQRPLPVSLRVVRYFTGECGD